MTTSEIPFDYFMICMILMACSSFFTRAGFIVMSGKFDLDKRVQRALKYLPAAAFPALFVPAIAFTRGTGDFAFNPIQIIAGSAALVVALYTKNIYATLGVGMCALWGLRYFVG
jgi:branched-subunit amino acid transport protein